MENIEELKKLVEKYLNHSATAADRLRICEWLESDIDARLWFQSQIDASNPEFDDEVKEGILDNIYSESSSVTPKHSWRYYMLSVAACFVAVVATVGAMYYFMTSPFEDKTFTVYTNTGNKSFVTLPDGTEVNLNTKSKITFFYDEATDSRVVNLSGEAYFDVAKDAEHPFYVQADNVKVECLGTKFNVNAYPESSSISVALTDGKVNVVSGSENMVISPDTRVSYDKKTGRMSKQSVEAINYCEWMNGYAYFNNERFDDITKMISRNYGVTVNITSPELKNEKFTGTIYQTDIHKVLSVLTAASGAKYEIINDSLINLSY